MNSREQKAPQVLNISWVVVLCLMMIFIGWAIGSVQVSISKQNPRASWAIVRQETRNNTELYVHYSLSDRSQGQVFQGLRENETVSVRELSDDWGLAMNRTSYLASDELNSVKNGQMPEGVTRILIFAQDSFVGSSP